MTTVSVFNDVPAGLAPALERRGFSELTAIQKAVLAPELAGRDLSLSSQTGSGKTVALGFVVADDLGTRPSARKKTKRAKPSVLVIAPTRELAAQLATELDWLFADLNARIAVLTGGTDYRRDFDALGRDPHILIGTPGRLLDHIRRGSVQLSALRSLVLDEADQMLDMGFRDELEAICDATPAQRCTHLVSATFPPAVLSLARRYQTDAVQVHGTKRGAANSDIEHVGHVVRPEDKVSAMINLLLAAPTERTLAFVRTRIGTNELALELGAHGFSVAGLSGDMGQKERTATLEAFRDGAVRTLVATDVAARGLDISDVARVIHFDLPENADALTHRSGRTGRAGNKGTSIMLVPGNARRRVKHLVQRAGISLAFKKLPCPQEIRRRAEGRLLAEVALEASSGTTPHVALAEQLLAQGDAVDIVAALIARGNHVGPCEPRDIQPVVDKKHDRARKPGKREREQARRNTNFVPFHITWGERHGANPSRLLAMVCRRGNVPGRAVGQIRIGEFRSVFEVDVKLADNFARAASQLDKRNPRVKIRRWTEKAPPRRNNHGKPQRHR